MPDLTRSASTRASCHRVDRLERRHAAPRSRPAPAARRVVGCVRADHDEHAARPAHGGSPRALPAVRRPGEPRPPRPIATGQGHDPRRRRDSLEVRQLDLDRVLARGGPPDRRTNGSPRSSTSAARPSSTATSPSGVVQAPASQAPMPVSQPALWFVPSSTIVSGARARDQPPGDGRHDARVHEPGVGHEQPERLGDAGRAARLARAAATARWPSTISARVVGFGRVEAARHRRATPGEARTWGSISTRHGRHPQGRADITGPRAVVASCTPVQGPAATGTGAVRA